MNAQAVFACVNALDNAIALARAGHKLDETAISQLENARKRIATEKRLDDDGNEIFDVPAEIIAMMEQFGFKRLETQYCFNFFATKNGFELRDPHDDESMAIMQADNLCELLEDLFGNELEEGVATGWVWLSYRDKTFSFDIHTRHS